MKIILTFLLFLVFPILATAQDELEAEMPADSTDMMSFGMGIDVEDSSPFIKVSIGNVSPLYRGFEGDNLDRLTGILGFETQKEEGEKLLKYTNYGVYGDAFFHDLQLLASETENEQQFSVGTIGLTSSKGYGWKLGENSSIILGIEDGFGWSKLNYNFSINDGLLIDNLIRTEGTAYDRLQNTYGDGIRVSEYFKAYMMIRPTDLISIDVSYGRQIIFPRFQLWYYTVSEIAEGVADGMTNLFVKKVMKSYEGAAPIVNFVLKTGLSFAFYQLRKDNMHWPMSTAPALVTNSFNIGTSFHF